MWYTCGVPKPKPIVIDIETAAVLLDMVRALHLPMSEGDAGQAIHEAWYVAPRLEEAILGAGLDPDDLDLPEIPPMPIGREE